MTTFTIGELSKATGTKVPTIRFYEGIGLLPEVPRTESNRRIYNEEVLKRLRFIRHARELGFELEAIRTMLAMQEQPEASCENVDALARTHLGEVESRIHRLTAMKEELERMISQHSHGSVADCRIIETLAN
ncbi:MAG: MerR family transcriptional regulator [Blastochloris viridis]|uniref:MerR family transcriptional regulator n=1 Tax=Blastochloris viridis TaxID=1079 RepID=A0A6N4RD74_BLAVI|nr:MAG: MerR family transcriptional regulator [Blastochloris viridis]